MVGCHVPVIDVLRDDYDAGDIYLDYMGAVSYTAFHGSRDVLQVLYETGGCDFGERSGSAVNAMAFAVIGGPEDYPEHLKDESEIAEYWEERQLEVVELLLEIGEREGIRWQVRDDIGRTPLEYAQGVGRERIVECSMRGTS